MMQYRGRTFLLSGCLGILNTAVFVLTNLKFSKLDQRADELALRENGIEQEQYGQKHQEVDQDHL